MNSMKKILPIALFLVIAAAGCSPSISSDMVNNHYIMPEPSLTETVTKAPAPTATSTSAQTPTITSTIIPTLERMNPAEAKVYVTNLLRTPGNCALPCFLGIIPGGSTWAEAENYFRAFAISIDFTGWTKDPRYRKNLVVVPVQNSLNADDFFSAVFLTSDDTEIVEGIAIVGSGIDQTFLIQSIFRDYGQPDEILLWSTGLTIGDPQNQLMLVYLDIKTVFIYTFETEVYGNPGEIPYVKVCTSDIFSVVPEVHMSNQLNDDNLDSTLDFISRFHFHSTLESFRQIHQVTNTTVEEFSSAMLDSGNSDFCFQSSIEHWEK